MAQAELRKGFTLSIVMVMTLTGLDFLSSFLSFFFFFLFFCCLFAISWAASVVYGSSQARGLIGAVAASLHQGHSNVGFELHLQPTPQLTATQDP